MQWWVKPVRSDSGMRETAAGSEWRTLVDLIPLAKEWA